MVLSDCNEGSGAPAEARVGERRLLLDLEDLRFENRRLRSSLVQAQAEILALTERNTALQQRWDRVARLAPRGTLRVLRWSFRILRRRRAR